MFEFIQRQRVAFHYLISIEAPIYNILYYVYTKYNRKQARFYIFASAADFSNYTFEGSSNVPLYTYNV